MAGILHMRKEDKIIADGPVELMFVEYHKGRASFTNHSPHATTITVLEPRERLRKKARKRLRSSRRSA